MGDGKKFKLPKIKLPEDFSMVATWVLLLIPAIIFWTSVIMYTGLGTDYVFDVVVKKLSESSLGNLLMVFSVIGCPILVMAVSGREYFKTKNKKMRWGLGIGAGFLVLGIFTLLKKS
jgi:hypothetical protein